MTPIYHSNDLLYNTEELTFLTDLSPTEMTWDEHRANAEDMAILYNRDLDFIKYADRINGCSGYLKFGVNPDQSKLVLKEVWFCRVRHCPVCQWRRSLRMRAMVYQNIEKIMSEYPSHRWIFLTLTVKNPHVTDLRSTIQEMNKGWQRLIQTKRFRDVVDGFIRTTEVTRPKKKKKKKSDPDVICPVFGNTHAHPHFHVMLFVKPSYFSTGYISQQKWSDLWRDVLRVDYQPIVDIRTVKPNKKKGQTEEDAIKSAVMETLKYAVKPDDMVGDGSKKANDWFYELTRQTFKLRFVASGGVLKNALKRDDDITDDDLVNTNLDDEEDTNTDDRRLVFTYEKVAHKYLYRPKYNQ